MVLTGTHKLLFLKFKFLILDLHRTFPENVNFSDGLSSKKQDLFNVLSAYAHYNPTVGYCQVVDARSNF